MSSQKEKAVAFGRLHTSGRILVLPNAWDVSSARIFEEAGFPAIATTSGGIAVSQGYQDGQKISRDEMIGAVRRIARSVSVPVSADMEAGYGASPEEAADTIREVISAGAVGVNIEDSTGIESRPLDDADLQAKKITAIRSAASAMDVPLIINARTDAFRYVAGSNTEKLEETIRRGTKYKSAGADCIFAFWVKDAVSISELVRRLRCPINVIAGAETPSIQDLERMGVARVTFGAGQKCATLGLLKRLANELLQRGTYTSMTEVAITNAEMNKLVSPRN